jgi:hypothetical protein
MMGASVWPMKTLAAADRVSAPLVCRKYIIDFAISLTMSCSTPR